MIPLAILAPGIISLLWTLLYVVLLIAAVGAIIYCVNAWIHPIPTPFLLVVAIAVIIISVILLLTGATGNGLPHP